MVIVLPSAETSVSSALTRCHAGLSTIAFSDEWMSFAGPRPHFSPLDTSSSSTTPFAPRLTVTMPSRSCDAEGMKTPTAFAQRRLDLGPMHELADVRRADLLLAFRDQHQVHRHLLAGAANGVQRREERRLRTLLIDRAAADDRPCRGPACRRGAPRAAARSTRRDRTASRRT